MTKEELQREQTLVKNFVKRRLVYDLLDTMLEQNTVINRVDENGNYDIQIGKKLKYNIHVCNNPGFEMAVIDRNSFEILDYVRFTNWEN